jgi:putative membrane protein
MMGGGLMGSFGMGYGIFGSFITLLFWIAIIGGIVFAIRRFSREGSWTSSPTQETPLDILKKRYAKGEIDREEFAAKRQELS